MYVCVTDIDIYPLRHSSSQREEAGGKECVCSLPVHSCENLCCGINGITGIVGDQYRLRHKGGRFQ